MASGDGRRMLETHVLEGEVLQSCLSQEDRCALEAAMLAIERRSLAMRLASLVGEPVQFLMRANNGAATEAVFRLTQAALSASLRIALSPLLPAPRDGSGRQHRML